MKHLRNAVWILALLGFGFQAHAQYVGASLGYAEIKPGQRENFLKLEEMVLKYHQARVDKGMITAWRLYEKIFSGSEEDYHYIWVHLNDDFKKTENPNDMALARELFTQEEMDELMKLMNETRSIIRNEYYDGVMFAEGGELAKYIRVNFYQVDKTQEYLKIREEYVLPVFEQFVKDGHLSTWGLWRKWPYYSDYQFLSVDGFATYGDWKEGLPAKKTVEKVLPGEDLNELSRKMMETRTLVKQEIWKLVKTTKPAGKE